MSDLNVSKNELQDVALPPRADHAYRPKKISKIFFPFEKVQKGENIILYGKGAVSDEYAQQIQLLGYCNLAGYAHTDAPKGSTYSGKPCLTPEELIDKIEYYDRIVVASSKYFDEIIDILRLHGVPPERIV